ncbi:MAG TPA: acyl carrier protein [Flavobacteriaceae bacterium]|jgi:acyl carrier protein|nr:acyl carrier protein [Flavobacteriaceae bacterium]MAM28876.1 acyl carrier protein [Flavobacteriaceae bacterium]MAY52015.1 acyl carrier protein [Flavobacteriaceae bacterium]HBR55381.1 acyl carrier protein [Flavobacteriaceae bacterium]|tara:strand:+ start:280 stop:525 length:246 start_codon:yes stop_codon:yes gene_type:complete
MTTEQIYVKLLPIVKTYLPEDVAADEINPDSDLTGELNINSAHLVDIVLDVEDAFEVEFANEDMESLRTLNDAIAIIHKKI